LNKKFYSVPTINWTKGHTDQDTEYYHENL